MPVPSTPTSEPRPLAKLEAAIVEMASQATPASAVLTRLIGEYDAAEGWREWGMRSTADWLSWHCAMSLGAAREQVRVARKLRELPVMTGEFEAGRLSYSKVRALTRFANPETEDYLVSMARHATGAQIEKLGRVFRQARREADVQGHYAGSYLKFTVGEDGCVTGSFRLPPAEGAELMQALKAGAGRLPDYQSEGDGDESPEAQRRRRNGPTARGYAWVLTAMAQHYLASLVAEAKPTQAERFQLVIRATAEQMSAHEPALFDPASSRPAAAPAAAHSGTAAAAPIDSGVAEIADGVPLHPSTLRRLTCDCPTSTMVEGVDGTPLHVGRRHRRISGRLRRAVEARDRGGCRAPGCTQPAVEIHHIRHWAHGGPTCLRNLISLCNAHHWVVHEGGFTVVVRSPGRWALLGPTGVVVEPEPPAATGPVSAPRRHDVAADAVTGEWNGEAMTRYALDVILNAIGAFDPTRLQLSTDVSAETSPRGVAA